MYVGGAMALAGSGLWAIALRDAGWAVMGPRSGAAGQLLMPDPAGPKPPPPPPRVARVACLPRSGLWRLFASI